MKKLVITLLLGISSLSFGQNLIGRIGNFAKFYEDNTIVYLDHKYIQVRDYKTINLLDEKDLFFKSCEDALNGNESTINIGDQNLTFEPVICPESLIIKDLSGLAIAVEVIVKPPILPASAVIVPCIVTSPVRDK